MFKKFIYIQVVMLSIVFCFFITISAAQSFETTLRGTWANMEYTEGTQRLIISADGSYVGYTKSDPTKACIRGNCKIVEKWSDTAGNRWYRSIFISDNGEKSFCLMKISQSGKIIECAHDSIDFPKFLSSEVYTYQKFYRQ